MCIVIHIEFMLVMLPCKSIPVNDLTVHAAGIRVGDHIEAPMIEVLMIEKASLSWHVDRQDAPDG